MTKLLHIQSSPRKQRSASIAVAQEFLAAYSEANPGDHIDNWDLWDTKLPEFDSATIDAKYQIMHGLDPSPEQAAAWKSVTAVFERFNSADKYVLNLPMWNFGIPYRLKHFIDIITQPGLAFSVSKETGYKGLITGKPITVIYARGGEYGSNEQLQAMDLQKQYIDLLLGFIGFTDIHTILIEPTMGSPDKTSSARSSATEAARRIAAGF
jgi:FMN-dependent NADH-azoreductase